MSKKKPVRSKEELLEEYKKLKKQKNNWWNVLASEGNSIKTIVGGFILYIGYLIVAALNADVLVLIYTIIVVGVLWYWVDMLRTQYEKHRSEYKKQMRILNTEIRRWSKKKIVADHPALSILERREYHIPKTLLPYIWGYAPEAIHQLDHYQYKNVSISSVQIKQERTAKEYWFLAVPLEQKFGEESTAILPKPYQHDKWQKVEFNEQIELPSFKENFNIYSSDFMHSYYLISKQKIENFLTLPTEDKWLVFRKNIAYLLLPKSTIDFDINQLDEVRKKVEEEATESMQLADRFLAILQH
jgi:hypothetical protein